MAGIGFELRKVISRGNFGSFVKAAISGIMIVAGPWLVSILSLTVVARFFAGTYAEAPTLFLAVLVYGYAGSLIVAGGFHYLFTRLIADLLYEKKERESCYHLVLWNLVIFPVSFALAFLAARVMPFEGVTHPGL